MPAITAAVADHSRRSVGHQSAEAGRQRADRGGRRHERSTLGHRVPIDFDCVANCIWRISKTLGISRRSRKLRTEPGGPRSLGGVFAPHVVDRLRSRSIASSREPIAAAIFASTFLSASE